MDSKVMRVCDAHDGPGDPIARRRGPALQPRLPIAPLLRQVELHTGEWNVRRFARLLGTTTGSLYRYAGAGVTVLAADRLAVRIGLHPCEVWGEAWWSL